VSETRVIWSVTIKPACGPKENEMEKKMWEWQGEEMTENEWSGGYKMISQQRSPGGMAWLHLVADTRAELYANAIKAGCVEVVRPVACPMCGGEAKAIKESGVVYTPHTVVCDGSCRCYIKGPSRESKNEAVTAWNDMAAMMERGKRWTKA
jgi:hypothetical protein